MSDNTKPEAFPPSRWSGKESCGACGRVYEDWWDPWNGKEHVDKRHASREDCMWASVGRANYVFDNMKTFDARLGEIEKHIQHSCAGGLGGTKKPWWRF